MTTPFLTAVQHQALLALGAALRARKYQFTTVTPATQARVLARPSAPEQSTLRDIFGWSRPFTAAAIDDELLACMHAAGVLEEQDELLRSSVRMSTLAGEWLFHSAYPTAQADAVFFGPDTCRFVRAMEQTPAPAADPVRRIADIGCGSGVGAITLARRFPQAEVLAVDINDRALALADVNIRLAGVENASAHHSNLLTEVDGLFDLIVANPPYLLDAAERAYRHGGGALGAGLALQIVQAAIVRLAHGGALWLYAGVAMADGEDAFLRQATAMLDEAGLRWTYEEIDPDVFGEELETPSYAGVERIAAVWLVASKEA